MAFRIIELVVADEKLESAKSIVSEFDEEVVLESMFIPTESNGTLLRAVTHTSASERLLDELRESGICCENSHVLVLTAEAAIDSNGESPEEPNGAKKNWGQSGIFERISRDELRSDIEEMSKISSNYCAMVALSTIVAAVGLYRNNVPVVVGAMVIAPLLGPNIALAFGTALGDVAFIRRALRINVLGVSIAFCISVLIGWFLGNSAQMVALAERTSVGIDDIAIAMASGVAGVLSLSAGASASLVGVMVAVALLPPLVAVGLLVSAGFYVAAASSVILLSINIVCINLAAITTFRIQSIRPSNWWEDKRAKAYTIRALLFWSALLALFAILLVVNKKLGAEGLW